MTNITLNPDQQEAFELLKANCKKVELYVNNDDQKEARCLLEDQKVIDVTFYSESELCISYTDFEDDDECQETYNNHELDEAIIERLFERVANHTDHLQYFCNQEYAQKIRDFLK